MLIKNYFWKRGLLWFDRSISSNRAWKPFLWFVVFCVVGFLLLIGVGVLCMWSSSYYHSGGVVNKMDKVISEMPRWYQWFMALIGTTFLTQYLGSTISNYLANRSASHRKGYLRYYFSDHVLILGGSKVVVGILKSISLDENLRKKEIVILTNQDAEELWEYIMPLLTEEELSVKVKLTIYHGERNMDKELRNSQVEKSSVIYIVGEDEEKEHDSINVDSWKLVRTLREKKSGTIAQCYLLLERNASTYVFNALPGEDTKTMETTIVNRLESVAQQVLIGDDERWKDYTLDRGKIDEKSGECVHFVVVGMTQMGYAMATTAAHLCHYPNFNEKTGSHRTKITFIDPNADEEMKMFWGRYPGLFELSHSCFRSDPRNRSNQSVCSTCPDNGFGDFMDVEWEFVKGSVVDDWVRDLLDKWRQEKKQIMTLAFCGENAEKNMAQALYLPREFFLNNGNNPLIWVYQPENSAMVETAHDNIGLFKNLLVFGTMTGCFDSRMDKRLAAAKRINYLYQNEKKNEIYGTMARQKVLDEMWHGLSYAEKMSNIYAANLIYGKFRCMGINEEDAVKESDIETLAMIEHARWNMEKLLVGFSALPKLSREELNKDIDGDDWVKKEKAQAKSRELKKQEFKHKDIAPYDALPEDSRKFDKAIVRNLADVIKGL